MKKYTYISPLFLIVFLSGCTLAPPCTETVLHEELDPSSQRKAVVFVSECGATTDFSTQVSITGNTSDRFVYREDEVVFVVKSYNNDIVAEWQDEKNIQISYTGPESWIYNKIDLLGNINIHYEMQFKEPAVSDEEYLEELSNLKNDESL